MESPEFSKPEISLSEHERELIKEIGKLPVDDGTKIDIILAWRKLKPATDVQFTIKEWYKEKRKSISPEEEEALAARATRLFQSLGLHFVKGEKIRRELHSAEENGEEKLVGETETQIFFCRF